MRDNRFWLDDDFRSTRTNLRRKKTHDVDTVANFLRPHVYAGFFGDADDGFLSCDF